MKRNNVIAWFFIFLIVMGITIGLGLLDINVKEYRDRYQFREDLSSEGRTPPCDRPLLELDDGELLLEEEHSLSWKIRELRIFNGESVLIAASEQPIELRIYFLDYVKAVKGYWRGERGELDLMLQGSLEKEFIALPGNKDNTWPDSLPDDFEEIIPYIDAVLPINEVDLTLPLEQRVIHVTSKITIVYPKYLDTSTFRNLTSTLTHEFDLLVLTPGELEEYLQVRSSERSRTVSSLLGNIGLSLLIIAISLILPIVIARKFKIVIWRDMW